MSFWLLISCNFLVIGIGWTLGIALSFIVHFISAFWQRNRPGFAELLGIHVALCFDDVFFSVIVILLMFHVYHLSSHFFLS